MVGCWLVRHDCALPEDPLFVLDQIRRGDMGAGDEPSPDITDQGAFIGSRESDLMRGLVLRFPDRPPGYYHGTVGDSARTLIPQGVFSHF